MFCMHAFNLFVINKQYLPICGYFNSYAMDEKCGGGGVDLGVQVKNLCSQ